MSESSNSSLVRFAGIVALGSVASKILGFLRETALASRFGSTYATDAYLMAMIIPTLILMGVGPAVTTTLIPVFTDIEKRKGRTAAFQSVTSIVNACVLVAAIISGAGMALARPLVHLVAPGFGPETYELTVTLTTIMFPIAVFSTITSVITGLLHAVGKFAAPALTGLAQNVVIISSIVFFGGKYGITAVAVGTLLGAASMLAVQLPALASVGYRHHIMLDWHDEGLRQAGRLIAPIVAGSAAGQAGTIVIRTLASRLPEGSITNLNYAQRLVGLPVTVLGASLITVLYPTLARLYSRDSGIGPAGGSGELDLRGTRGLRGTPDLRSSRGPRGRMGPGPKGDFLRASERAVGIVFFVLAPMAVGLMALSTPVVRLAFERGAFTDQSTSSTAIALVYASIAIPAMSLSELMSKTFYAMHDTITPMLVGVGAVGVNVVISIALVGTMGHAGLALAGSCQPIAVFVTLYLVFRARVRRTASGQAPGYSLGSSALKTLVATCVMSVSVVAFAGWIEKVVPGHGTGQQIIRLATSVGAGGVVYIAVAAALRSEELCFAVGAAKKRIAARR
ncbi:MAG: lipid II flippase MurJ [Clostridia bacterium]|nr:lipid II flippase MurJ [Clostridia bacterium]